MRGSIGRFLFAAFNALVVGLMVVPVLFVVWSAFYDSPFLSFPPPGYTLSWFSEALNHQAFLNGAITSLKLALCSSIIGVIIGTLASLVLVRTEFRGRGALNSILLSPLIVPNIVLGIALYMFFIWLADQGGLDLTTGFWGLLLAHVLLTLPWSVRLISANLIGLDRSVEEAAMNLGANGLKTFFHATVPQMRSGVIAAALFSFIISFENLEISLLLVGPGSTTLPIALMQYLEFNINPTVAAASTLQVVLIVGLLLLTDRHVKLSRIV
ncbi:ABC transporter permease [Castellaniella sp.]|uniref:ABC transporter permease n=1 Tax=Castellaniella sp. TaxID=1955812 RepID=UPI003C795ADF